MQKNQTGLNLNLSAQDINVDSAEEKQDISKSYNMRLVKPSSLCLKNIMGIKDMNIDLSNNVTVFIGDNSTGKTSILKVLYSLVTGVIDSDQTTKSKIRNSLEGKIQQVFRPENLKIGNVVKNGEANASVEVVFDDERKITAAISSNASEHISMEFNNFSPINCSMVYIPPKEMASIEGFVSLYESYNLSFEEMYYRISKQIAMPAYKQISDEKKKIIEELSVLLNGSVILRDGKLYLKSNSADRLLEMGLLSEGYKKIVILMQLLINGNIGKGSVLIWDEPETNMNPKMSIKLVNALNALARNGVQVIVTTHDYFVAQEFAIKAKYEADDFRYKFYSLYKVEEDICMESSNSLFDIEHNAIMEEFDELYDRENRLSWQKIQ